jgi:hypothetical protein
VKLTQWPTVYTRSDELGPLNGAIMPREGI